MFFLKSNSSLKHDFFLPKALKSEFKAKKSSRDTLSYPPPPLGVTYYLNGPLKIDKVCRQLWKYKNHTKVYKKLRKYGKMSQKLRKYAKC